MDCSASYQLTTPPTVEPVELEGDVKKFIKVEHNEEDALITALIKAARARIEERGICCITQTWKMFLQYFPRESEIVIRKRPVQSITSVKYKDGDGAVQTLASNAYQVNLNGHLATIKPANGQYWPGIRSGDYDSVTVEFVAGYGATVASVHPDIAAALRMNIAHLYEDREGALADVQTRQFHMAYQALTAPHVVMNV